MELVFNIPVSMLVIAGFGIRLMGLRPSAFIPVWALVKIPGEGKKQEHEVVFDHVAN